MFIKYGKTSPLHERTDTVLTTQSIGAMWLLALLAVCSADTVVSRV